MEKWPPTDRSGVLRTSERCDRVRVVTQDDAQWVCRPSQEGGDLEPGERLLPLHNTLVTLVSCQVPLHDPAQHRHCRAIDAQILERLCQVGCPLPTCNAETLSFPKAVNTNKHLFNPSV